MKPFMSATNEVFERKSAFNLGSAVVLMSRDFWITMYRVSQPELDRSQRKRGTNHPHVVASLRINQPP